MVYISKQNYFLPILALLTVIITISNPAIVTSLKILAFLTGMIVFIQTCKNYKATIEKDSIIYEKKFLFLTYKKIDIPASSIEKISLQKDLIVIHSQAGKNITLFITNNEFLMAVEAFAESHSIPFKLLEAKKGLFFQ